MSGTRTAAGAAAAATCLEVSGDHRPVQESESSGTPGTNPDYDEFFRLHYSGIVRSLTLMAGDAEIAADVVQEAFIRAYVRWGRISRYDHPAAWIRRVAINCLRDAARSTTRRNAVEERAAQEPDRTVVEPGTDDTTHLASILMKLPMQQRTAIALFYLEDLSLIESAASMGISPGAVKYHLHKGRAALGLILGTDPESDAP